MKKFLTAVAMALLLVGCAKETVDLTGINEKLAELDNRVSALEGAIASIQSAIGDGVFVQKVEQYADPETGKTVGVTVTYTSGKVVYFEISPKADYAGPVLSVITSGSGALVWAVDGVAIKDKDGKEVPVNKTPVFTIDDDGNLLVSIDGGDPVIVGQVQNEGATLIDGIFKDIKVEQDKVVLTLSDDSIVNIPFAAAFKLNIEETEYAYDKMEAIEIPFTLTAATTGTVVGVAGYDPLDFVVDVDMEAKKIIVTPIWNGAAGVFMAYADTKVGLTSIVNLTVAPVGVSVLETDDSFWDEENNVWIDYIAEGDVEELNIQVVSNVLFDVIPEAEWIEVAAETKTTVTSIPLTLKANTTEEYRDGKVFIVKKGTDPKEMKDADKYQTIIIRQLPSPVTGPENLSKKGAANSYIITKAGDYTFAAVKGNTTTSVGTVAKAELIWETENTATAPAANSIIAKVSYVKGYIYFSTPETLKPGNALIAAKDAEGKILWSWHIWIPKTTITDVEEPNYSAKKTMSRNLGALVDATIDAPSSVESFGMLYEWGRKDPFPGLGVLNGAGAIAVVGTEMTKKEAPMTIEEAIQNPTVYVIKNSTSKDWLPEGTAAEVISALWGETEKTMYDPCPVGYMLPQRNSDLKFWSGSDMVGTDVFTLSTDNCSYKVGSLIFPLAGYIDEGSEGQKKAGIRTLVWSARWDSGTVNGYGMYGYTDDGTHFKRSGQVRTRGGSIRCVVDDGTPVIPDPPAPIVPATDLSKDATANCYIVSAAGDFKFKPVKGNSTESVGTVASAALIWETENTATAPTANSIITNVGFEDGFITFSTPETLKPGNALIAAKDAEGKILWSWHIWIPKTTITDVEEPNYSAKKTMSRNLGALVDATIDAPSSVESFGMLYEWGRKDPFPGLGVLNGAGAIAVVGTEMTKKEAPMTIEEAIQNPTVYVIKNSTSKDWLPEGTAAEVISALWGETEKTMYDPCPVGYMLPQRNSDLKFWSGSDMVGTDVFTLSTDNCSYKVGSLIFPLAGYIDEGSEGQKKAGIRTLVWSARWDSGTVNGYGMYGYTDDGTHFKRSGQVRTRGGSVRCVVEPAPAAE